MTQPITRFSILSIIYRKIDLFIGWLMWKFKVQSWDVWEYLVYLSMLIGLLIMLLLVGCDKSVKPNQEDFFFDRIIFVRPEVNEPLPIYLAISPLKFHMNFYINPSRKIIEAVNVMDEHDTLIIASGNYQEAH